LIGIARRDKNSAMTAHQYFPFLSLVPEIRNRVYAILFEHDDPLCIVNVVDRDDIKSLLHRYVHDKNDRLASSGEHYSTLWYFN